MTGLSAIEACEKQIELPCLVVLGAGNTSDGPAFQTVHNARVAAQLMIAGVAPLEAIACGYGPDSSEIYPRSEARVIARAIERKTADGGLLTIIHKEEKSTNTHENIQNIGLLVERLGLDALTVVAAIGQADKACAMSRKILGKQVEVMPVYSNIDKSKAFIAQQRFLTGLYSVLTLGVDPDDSGALNRAHGRYDTVVRIPKMIARASSIFPEYAAKLK